MDLKENINKSIANHVYIGAWYKHMVILIFFRQNLTNQKEAKKKPTAHMMNKTRLTV